MALSNYAKSRRGYDRKGKLSNGIKSGEFVKRNPSQIMTDLKISMELETEEDGCLIAISKVTVTVPVTEVIGCPGEKENIPTAGGFSSGYQLLQQRQLARVKIRVMMPTISLL